MTADTSADRSTAGCLCIWILCVCVRWEQYIVEMINSTLRYTRTQRLIIMKHVLSLQEPRQSEKGTYACPGPSRARPPADKCGVKWPWRLWVHVCSAKPTVWGHAGAEMIKVAATHIKSQTLGIRYLNRMAKGAAFLQPTKTSTLGKTITSVYSGWLDSLCLD